jgi:hypothetical protein
MIGCRQRTLAAATTSSSWVFRSSIDCDNNRLGDRIFDRMLHAPLSHGAIEQDLATSSIDHDLTRVDAQSLLDPIAYVPHECARQSVCSPSVRMGTCVAAVNVQLY